MLSWIQQFGAFINQAFFGAGFSLQLLGHTMVQAPALSERRTRVVLFRQMFICGIETIPVTVVVTVFTGMILALNGGLSLQQIGQEHLLGQL